MSYRREFSILLSLVVAVGLVLVCQTIAEAQCSMCRASLAGSRNADFIRNFNLGVLVLLIPPVSIFCSIFIVLRRYKNGGEDDI